MALREKSKARGWRVFAGSSQRDQQEPILSPRRRGALYLTVVLLALWILFGRSSSGSGTSSGTISNSLRNQAMRLTSSVTDQDIYGPPVVPLKQRPLHPAKSSMAPLRSWTYGVPESTVHGISGGAFASKSLMCIRKLNELFQAGPSWTT